MKEFYAQQVRESKRAYSMPSMPTPDVRSKGSLRTQALMEPRPTDCMPRLKCFRILQWNLNCLCGIDGQTAQSARDVLELLTRCSADVLVLQEVRGPNCEAEMHT